MITLTREEAQQVLDAIVLSMPMFVGHSKQHAAATELLRARLAQPEHVSYAGNGTAGMEDMTAPTGFFFQMPKPEPEPVAWQGVYDQTDLYYRKPLQADVRPLYTTPPQRKWQGLTDEEKEDIREGHISWTGDFFRCESPELAAFIRAIEAKLKEKNASHL